MITLNFLFDIPISFHISKFNFSGIDTSNEEATIKGFKNEVASSIKVFVEKID